MPGLGAALLPLRAPGGAAALRAVGAAARSARRRAHSGDPSGARSKQFAGDSMVKPGSWIPKPWGSYEGFHGFSDTWGVPQNGWFGMKFPPKIWMMTGGTPMTQESSIWGYTLQVS